MLLLHISDIHFESPHCFNSDMDPDRVFRTRMLMDIREEVRKLGPVDAILIGGDIAYKGAEEEYDFALKWIKELVEVARCKMERVYTIPGNHDVDRGLIKSNPAIRNAQQAIMGAQEGRERVLREQFTHEETSQSLLKSIGAYNGFAAAFNCQIYSPDRLYWKQDLELAPGVKLRVFGLTTTLLWGFEGKDDERNKLYVSPLQTVLDPEENVVMLVMAHHPPDWCMDNDDIEQDLNDRSHIQLFGHKHLQRITPTDRYVKIAAAAVNPKRSDANFEPGYNFIHLTITGSGKERTLEIDAHLRQLQRNPEIYRPRMNGEKTSYKTRLPFPGTPENIGKVHAKPAATSPVSTQSLEKEMAVDTETAMSHEHTRNLIYRFWQLTISQRRDIAQAMGLLNEGEMALPEAERYGRALLRVGERGQVDELAKEVKKREAI